MPDRYAYLGPEGTFAQQALLTLDQVADGVGVPCPNVPAVCAAVRRGDADFGFIPVENTVEGPVSMTTDELVVGEPLLILREVFLEVSFVLAARPGTSLQDVRSVITHPHAYAQVKGWLESNLPGMHYVAAGSTAEAARIVGAGEHDAAVCARIAADNHGLEVLAERIEDSHGAVTRFALVSLPGALPQMTGNDRTSFVVHIRQEQAGALSGVLEQLASRSINLTRIESRPWRERHGEYHFILECEGHIADPRIGEALAALHRICADVRFLGSYPRGDRQNEQLPPYATDEAFARSAQWVEAVRRGECTQ